MKTKPATEKSPGIPGWKWASGLKPRKGDKFWSAYQNRAMDVNEHDLKHERYGAPDHFDFGWSGYIRRVRKTKPKKPKGNLPKAAVVLGADCSMPSVPIVGNCYPCAVIPCANRQIAAALVAKHNRRAAR